jgi:transposase
VKPFIKRQKNDAADAEAICEAAQRPTMRFVAPKSEQTQAAALVFRARDLLVKQRTQIINAPRGHLAEFGLVVAKGPAHVPHLVRAVADPDEPIPEIARPVLQMLIEMLHRLDEQIARLDREIAQRARENETARRLMTIPGVGPVTAVALAALAPPAETFKGSVANPDIGHTRTGMGLRSGGRSEESCNEGALRAHVIRWGTDNLSFADHRHGLVARNCP